MTPETKFKIEVKRWLKKMGIYHIGYPAGQFSVRGVPDSLLCISGKFIGVEFKIFPNKLSEYQIIQIEKIRQAGGIVWVLYPYMFEEFKLQILELIDNEK